MAFNSQQFGTHTHLSGKINELNTNSHLDQHISTLTTLVQQLAVGQVKTCGVCSIVGHLTNIYLTLPKEHTNVIGGFWDKGTGMIFIIINIIMDGEITLILGMKMTIKHVLPTINLDSLTLHHNNTNLNPSVSL